MFILCFCIKIWTFKFSLNDSFNSLNSVSKNICHYHNKGSNLPPFVLETRMLRKCQQETYERQDLKLSPIHHSVIYQIPWIRQIHWISIPFRENSIGPFVSLLIPLFRTLDIQVSSQSTQSWHRRLSQVTAKCSYCKQVNCSGIWFSSL